MAVDFPGSKGTGERETDLSDRGSSRPRGREPDLAGSMTPFFRSLPTARLAGAVVLRGLARWASNMLSTFSDPVVGPPTAVTCKAQGGGE